ncbi:hypothetical protein AGMMS49546_32110 [Spirochaetia bacterium]|nr:hypothetical protein AGMMS49546_32110 [Spirochaetia bacterium]
MKRPCLLPLLVCLSLSLLPAQDKTIAPAADPAQGQGIAAEPAPEAAEPVPPFAIIPLLETAFAAELSWRPDWPLEIPPDAFSVKGKAVLISLMTGDAEYRLRRDGEGRLAEFPALVGGALVQAEAFRGSEGGILGLSLGLAPASPDGGESEPWAVDFPGPLLPGSALSAINSPGREPVRVSRGESVYFVLFQESEGEISETWYDPAGSFVGYYRVLINRHFLFRNGSPWRIISIEGRSDQGTETVDYRFESGGNISEAASSRGIFSAVYGAAGRPLYWEHIPAQQDQREAGAEPQRPYALQWDEQGFLVRMRGAADGADNPDYRYEYDLDGRLNWVERRETGMIRRFGVLAPASIRYIRRQISYGEE